MDRRDGNLFLPFVSASEDAGGRGLELGLCCANLEDGRGQGRWHPGECIHIKTSSRLALTVENIHPQNYDQLDRLLRSHSDVTQPVHRVRRHSDQREPLSKLILAHELDKGTGSCTEHPLSLTCSG